MTQSRHTHWRVVPLLMALTFMGHFNRVAISVAGSERIIEQYGINPTRMGLVYSAFLLSYTIFMTPAGIFADRFGPWIALGLMAFGLAAGSVATGAVGVTVAAGQVGGLFGWHWAVALGAVISLSGALFWLGVRPAKEPGS